MGFKLCIHCGTPIADNGNEGDYQEGSCNWCKQYYEEMPDDTNGGYY